MLRGRLGCPRRVEARIPETPWEGRSARMLIHHVLGQEGIGGMQGRHEETGS